MSERMSERFSESMVEICRYLENRFGNGSTVSSQLTGFGFKALPVKGYTTCSLLADAPTLVSKRKARRCLAFWQRELFKVFAKFEPSSDIDASGSNLDQNLDRAIVRQGPDHGGIWRISRRVAQNGVLKTGTSEVISKGKTGTPEAINEVINEAIRNEPGINKPRLVRLVGKSRATVERAIVTLVAAGKIEHRGSKKTGGYYAI